MWIDIKGYEGLYKISDSGQVKSLKNHGRRKKDRILKFDISNNGYLRVTLSKNNKQKRFLVHRLVYENFISEIPEGLVINHKDMNRKNNDIKNLELISQHENNQLKSNTKLDKSKVQAIRNSKLSKEMLSELYGVHIRTIERVINGDRWANI
nr:NUMOD4 motif-containing HNH endonuclease [uncultured Cellulosilyticum sp.]